MTNFKKFDQNCNNRIKIFKEIVEFISNSIKENSSLVHYVTIKSNGKIELVFPDFSKNNIRSDIQPSLEKLFSWKFSHVMNKTCVISHRNTHRRRRKNKLV